MTADTDIAAAQKTLGEKFDAAAADMRTFNLEFKLLYHTVNTMGKQMLLDKLADATCDAATSIKDQPNMDALNAKVTTASLMAGTLQEMQAMDSSLSVLSPGGNDTAQNAGTRLEKVSSCFNTEALALLDIAKQHQVQSVGDVFANTAKVLSANANAVSCLKTALGMTSPKMW